MKLKHLFIALISTCFLQACEKSPSQASQIVEPVEKKSWKENTNRDKFTNEIRKTAHLESENSQIVGLGARSVRAEIIAFKNPGPQEAAGKVWFNGSSSMPLGLTYDYGSCYSAACVMMAKFDDGQIIKYPVFEPPHGSVRGQLIINSKDFFNKAFKAKKIEIRVAFYQEGNGDFIFKSDTPFTWTSTLDEKPAVSK
jgi:hypothetical protein